jgi:hypothetical protein
VPVRLLPEPTLPERLLPEPTVPVTVVPEPVGVVPPEPELSVPVTVDCANALDARSMLVATTLPMINLFIRFMSLSR